MRVVLDNVVYDPKAERLDVDEARAGSARLTRNRERVMKAIEDGKAVPVGQKAESAGLVPGSPIGGQTGGGREVTATVADVKSGNTQTTDVGSWGGFDR